jgi:hypothetical protein
MAISGGGDMTLTQLISICSVKSGRDYRISIPDWNIGWD